MTKAKERDPKEIDRLRANIERIKKDTPQLTVPLAPGVDDASLLVLANGPSRTKIEYKPGVAQDLPMQIRGNPANPGPVVPRRFLAVLSPAEPRPFTAAAAGSNWPGPSSRRGAALGPRHRQPRLAAAFRHGPGRDAQRLRHPGRTALASATARRSDRPLHGERLVDQMAAPRDHALGRVSAGQPSCRASRRPRSTRTIGCSGA